MFPVQHAERKFILVPLLCGLAAVAISVLLYTALITKHKADLKSASNAEATAVINQLSIVLKERVQGFERMAARWEFEEAAYSKDDWIQNTGAYHAHFMGLEASAWADKSAIVRWGFPAARTSNYIGYDLSSEPQRAHAFNVARSEKRTVFLPMIELKTGVFGFAAYTPIYYGKRFHGILINAFNAKEFFASQLQHEKFGYVVSSGGHESFKSEELNRSVIPEAKSSMRLRFRELDWEVQVFASDALVQSQKSLLPESSLAVGLLFSFLISWIVRLNLLNRQAKREAWYDLVWQRAIVNGSDLGIISTDLKGVVQSMNPGAETITGFCCDEAVGKLTPFAWHDPAEISSRTSDMETKRRGAEVAGIDIFIDGIESGGISKQVWKIVAKDGHAKIVSMSVHRLTYENGTPFGLVGILEDISERLEHLRQLDEQKIKLVQAAKFAALGEMAAAVAHEINNPVAIITGKVFGLSKMIENSEIESGRFLSDLRKIDATARRIAKITRGLQNFSRDSSSDPFLEISIDDLVGSSVALCMERFKIHGIFLSVLTPDQPLFVMSRSFQLSQVLVNLLSNAFDAAVVSEDKWVKLDIRQDGDRVNFEVRDSGAGVSEILREKILQPFFTTKPLGKGTGLGLSISMGIVRDHGGDLTFKSGSEGGHFQAWVPLVSRTSEGSLNL